MPVEAKAPPTHGNGELSSELDAPVESYVSVGKSEPRRIIGLAREMEQVMRVANVKINVLLQGETGTGKELLANAIHDESDRRGPFVALNCAAVPETLFESELFGHVKGAFTGASFAHDGVFSRADQGTLLLDEVSELSLHLQTRLLRVLQERSFAPLGSDKEVQVDVRVIAATNRDLSSAVEANKFREDLFHRLNVFPITVRPLRDRIDEDMEPLVNYFLKMYAKQFFHGRERKFVMAPAAMDYLKTSIHQWPGNARELENVIQRMLIHVDGDRNVIELADVLWALDPNSRPDGEKQQSALGEMAMRVYDTCRLVLAGDTSITIETLKEAIELCGGFKKVRIDMENMMIDATMKLVGRNQSETARILGLGRTTLVEKLRLKSRKPNKSG